MRKKLIKAAMLVLTQPIGAHQNSETDICYFFSHGLADSFKQAYKYTKSGNPPKPSIIDEPLTTFNYPDACSSFLKLNRFKTSLAQDNEIACLADAFSPIHNRPSILMGVSRGASTIINFMSLHDPPNVRALVLESPFDSIDSIAQMLINETKLGCVPGLKKYSLTIVSKIFCKYKPTGIKPIDQAKIIRKDLPIFIICSLQDKIVPAWSSINLYKELYRSGHTNTYLLIVPEGSHAQLINNPSSGNLYQQTVHAFYCKFGLPHDACLAIAGMPILDALCQPNPEALNHLYPRYIITNEKQLPTKNKERSRHKN